MKLFLENLGKLNKFGGSQKKRIIANAVLNIITIVISVVTPLISAKMIVSLTDSLFDQLLFLAVMYAVLRIFSRILMYFMRGNYQKIHRESFTELQIKLGTEILKLDNNTLDEHGSGVFISRVNSDAGKIADIYNVLLNDIGNIVSSLGILGAVLIVNFWAFLYMLIQTLIMYVLHAKRSKIFNENDKVCRKINERNTGFIGEVIRGARDIKMLNAEKSFLRRISDNAIEFNQKKYEMNEINRKYNLWIDLLYWVADLGFIFFIVYMCKFQGLIIAEAIILYNYSGRADSIIWYITDILDRVKDFNLSSERVFSILDSKEFTKEKFGKKSISDVKGNFEFKKVNFSYKDKQVLNNLSFKIKSGETVAFVGKSGAGKTTLFNLLCKMYDVEDNHIFIDGYDINELNKDSIRGNITIISQSPYIYNLSIKENLKLVKEDLTDEEMIEACKTACLDDFISGLPDGYDTVIGEGGVNLSGGQKQRLAIARALIQKTKIILFDEATSALDNETQAKIQEAIDNMKGEYTILIIAHRLSTIINSDRILFLNNGKIEASGKHLELLQNCKAYNDLYKAELKSNK